jgi:hypothetical protein
MQPTLLRQPTAMVQGEGAIDDARATDWVMCPRCMQLEKVEFEPFIWRDYTGRVRLPTTCAGSKAKKGGFASVSGRSSRAAPAPPIGARHAISDRRARKRSPAQSSNRATSARPSVGYAAIPSTPGRLAGKVLFLTIGLIPLRHPRQHI